MEEVVSFTIGKNFSLEFQQMQYTFAVITKKNGKIREKEPMSIECQRA